MDENNQIILFASLWFVSGIVLVFFVKGYFIAIGGLLSALAIFGIYKLIAKLIEQ